MSQLLNNPRVSRLKLELLEAREQPASLLTGVVAGGVLTLTGDDLANVFVLKDTGTDMVVTGDANNQIRVGLTGTPAATQTFTGVNAIKLVLNGGNDSISLDNTVALNLTGAFSADMGGGNNTLNLSGGSAAASSIGSLSYLGSYGTETLSLGAAGHTTSVSGAVTFVGGDGTATSTFTRTDIAGSFTYTGLTGNDTVTLGAGTVLHKNVTANFGSGLTGQNLLLGGANIKGNVTIRGDKGQLVAQTGTQSSIDGTVGVSIDAGAFGNSSLILQGGLNIPNGGVVVTGKNGNSTLNGVTSTNLTVGKDLKISNDTVFWTTSAFSARNVSVSSRLDASISLNSTTSISGSFTATSSFKSAAMTLNGPAVTFNGPVSLTGSLGAYISDSTSGPVSYGSSLSLISSQDGTSYDKSGTGALTINGTTTIKAFGSAFLDLTGAGEKKLLNDVQITGTTGDSQVLVQTGKVTFGHHLKLFGLRTLATLSATAPGSSVVGDLVLNGGFGDDLATINGGFNVLGNAIFNGGPRGNLLVSLGSAGVVTEVGSLTVQSVNGTLSLFSLNFKNNGSTLIKSGVSADGIFFDQTTFAGLFNLDSGEGDDQLFFAGSNTNSPVAFTSKATIRLGGGNDTLFLGTPGVDLDKATFAVASTIDGGTGVNSYDDEVGQGLLTLNLTLSNLIDPTP